MTHVVLHRTPQQLHCNCNTYSQIPRIAQHSQEVLLCSPGTRRKLTGWYGTSSVMENNRLILSVAASGQTDVIGQMNNEMSATRNVQFHSQAEFVLATHGLVTQVGMSSPLNMLML